MSWNNKGSHQDYWDKQGIGELSKIDREKRNEELDRNWINSLPCVNCPIAGICKGVGGFTRPNYNSEFFVNNVMCKKKELYKLAKSEPAEMPRVYEGTAADSGNEPPNTGGTEYKSTDENGQYHTPDIIGR